MKDEKYKCPECYREAGRQHSSVCTLTGIVEPGETTGTDFEDIVSDQNPHNDEVETGTIKCLRCGEPLKCEHKKDCLHAGTVRIYDCVVNEDDRFTLTHHFHKDNEAPTPADDSGYDSLAATLREAYEQAATGKGKDRHANGQPFTEQPIMWIEEYFPSFQLGQAVKKIHESQGLAPDYAIKELLGAINFISAKIIQIKRKDQ